MKKRIVSLAVALALCLGLTIQTYAVNRTFSDVPAGAWYSEWIEKAVAEGLISGYSDGRFGPNDNVTYAQLAVMLLHALSPQEKVQPSSPWWRAYVEAADGYGILDETNMAQKSNWTSFAEKPITREQMAQMVYNTMEAADPTAGRGLSLRTSAEEITDYLSGESDFDTETATAVLVCHARKLLSGDANGYFHPKAPMTRAEAAVVICRVSANVGRPVTAPVLGVNERPGVRPDGAVGGQYDIARYDVPADVNKDGWITEAEVQAVLDQLRNEYPDDYIYDSQAVYNSPAFGGGRECAYIAFLFSDRIFGNLPKYVIPIDQSRVGDVQHYKTPSHWGVILNDFGKGTYEGVVYPESYTTVDGGFKRDGGKSCAVYWGMVSSYADWPTRDIEASVYSRYPREG